MFQSNGKAFAAAVALTLGSASFSSAQDGVDGASLNQGAVTRTADPPLSPKAAEVIKLLEADDALFPQMSRERAREVLASDTALLKEVLAQTTKGRASLGVRLDLKRAAAIANVPVEVPERNNLQDIAWAVERIDTAHGSTRNAVYEILAANPLALIHFESLDNDDQSRNAKHVGSTIIHSVYNARDRNPLGFIESLCAIDDQTINLLLEKEVGRNLLVGTVEVATSRYLRLNNTLSAADQTALLGASKFQLEKQMVKALEKVDGTTSLSPLLTLMHRVARVGDAKEQLEKLAIPIVDDGARKAGFLLLKEVAQNDPKRVAVVEDLLHGLRSHLQSCPEEDLECIDHQIACCFSHQWHATKVYLDIASGLSDSDTEKFKRIGYSPAAFRDLYRKSVSTIDSEALLHLEFEGALIDSFLDAPGEANERVLGDALLKLQLQPVPSYSVWKLDTLSDWSNAIKTLHALELPQELYPAELVRETLPPDHFGGYESSYRALNDYIRFAGELKDLNKLSAESKSVVALVLTELTKVNPQWDRERCDEALEAVDALESILREAPSAAREEKLSTAVRSSLKKLQRTLEPEEDALPLPGREDQSLDKDQPGLQSLERVLKMLKELPRR